MARKTTKPKHHLAGGHLALGLGLLGGACGATEETGQQETHDPGVIPGSGGTASGTGGSSFLPGTGGNAVPPGTGGTPTDPTTCDVGAGVTAQGLLAPYVVSNEQVGRRTLYSWTNAAQIEELRADPTLFTRSANAAGERGRASDYVRSLSASDDIAAILVRPEFDKKRFAWTNAWATALGWADETYGNQLLEIRLKAEAWIGRLSTITGTWAFFDTLNRPVALAEVRKAPERIAGFYFVDDAARGGCGATFSGGTPYREYVLCNEAMIEEWSASTEELRTHLTNSITAAEALRDVLASDACTAPDESFRCFQRRVVGLWGSPKGDLLSTFEGSLAFPNELYVPTATNVDNLVQGLRKLLFVPSPLRHSYLGDAGNGPTKP